MVKTTLGKRMNYLKQLLFCALLCTADAYSMNFDPQSAQISEQHQLTPEQEAKLLAQQAHIEAQLPEIELSITQAERLLEESQPAIKAAITQAGYGLVDKDVQNTSIFGSFPEKLLYPFFSEPCYWDETSLADVEHILRHELSLHPEGSAEYTQVETKLTALREMTAAQEAISSRPYDYDFHGRTYYNDERCKQAAEQIATLQQEIAALENDRRQRNPQWSMYNYGFNEIDRKRNQRDDLQRNIDHYNAYKPAHEKAAKLDSEHPFLQESFNLNIGLYGTDLINAGLLAGHALNDYLLFQKLKRYSNEQILTTIMLYKNEILTLLHNVNRNIDGTIIDDENISALYNFFSLNCFNTKIATFLSNYKTLGIAINYIAFKELLAGLERNCSNSEKTTVNVVKNYVGSNINLALHGNGDADERAVLEYANAQHSIAFKKYWRNWSISSIVKPLITIAAGKEALLMNFLPTIRSCALSISGTPKWYMDALDSYAFHLLKSSLVTTYFIKQIDAHYNQNWQHFLLANIDLLTAFITPLVDNATNKEQLTKHQNALEQFINERATASFVAWWEFKSKRMARTELVIEALLLTPAWIKLIKISPQLYEFANQ